MAESNSLQAHLVEELIDLHDAEEQLVEALPKLARSATSRVLRTAFQKHLKETRGHITRLDEALRALGETPRSRTCEAMQGLLEEGQSVMSKTPEGALRDAVMITGAQKVEHYEIASYGTARTYAQVLGEQAVARLLDQTLREEKAADQTLTQIAKSSINEEAADEWQSQKEDDLLTRSAEWAGTTATTAARQLSGGVRRLAGAIGVAHDRTRRTRPRPSNRRTTPKKRSHTGRKR